MLLATILALLSLSTVATKSKPKTQPYAPHDSDHAACKQVTPAWERANGIK